MANRKKTSRVTAASRRANLEQFVDRWVPQLPAREGLAWIVLHRHERPGRGAAVSFSELAEFLGTSRDTALRAVGALLDRGLLKTIEPGSTSERTPNVYRTVVPID